MIVCGTVCAQNVGVLGRNDHFPSKKGAISSTGPRAAVAFAREAANNELSLYPVVSWTSVPGCFTMPKMLSGRTGGLSVTVKCSISLARCADVLREV